MQIYKARAVNQASGTHLFLENCLYLVHPSLGNRLYLCLTLVLQRLTFVSGCTMRKKVHLIQQ